MFNLKRAVGNNKHPLMQELTDCTATLNEGEQYLFDDTFQDLGEKIGGWNEEMLKMNLIAFILRLGHLRETDRYKTYYESIIEATIENNFLKVKADMMIAKGILEIPDTPYFFFKTIKN